MKGSYYEKSTQSNSFSRDGKNTGYRHAVYSPPGKTLFSGNEAPLGLGGPPWAAHSASYDYSYFYRGYLERGVKVVKGTVESVLGGGSVA